MQNLEKEVWKTVEEHPNYYVSNLGRVFSVKLNRILEGYIDKTRNYKRKNVDVDGNIMRLHRIVAKAFPEICGEWFNKCEVHHLDFNPLNNRADNLKVCTKEEHLIYHHDSRVEMLKKRTGDNHPMFGKKQSEEARRKISDANRGEKNHNYGKTPSEETRRKISEGYKRYYDSLTDEEKKAKYGKKGEKNPNYGKKFTEEHRRKISQSKIEKNCLGKTVYQYTLDGQFVQTWKSAMAVKRELGYWSATISECCRGKRKTAYGYKWRFKSDVENEKQNNPGW